jgi:hypothetical protein
MSTELQSGLSKKTYDTMIQLLKKIENGSSAMVRTEDVNKLKWEFEKATEKKLQTDYLATNFWQVRLAQ